MKPNNTKPFYKKPIPLALMALVLVAGYILSEPPATKTSSVTPKAKKSSSSSSKTAIQFTEEDEKASFGRAGEVAKGKNAFYPVIAKGGISGGLAANSIPSDFAGGEGNWVYTGSAEINGVRTALLENRQTNEGAFLKVGERWKSAVVTAVGRDTIVMEGPSGTRTFGLISEESSFMPRIASGSSSFGGNSGFAPAQVNIPNNLRGQIGELPSVTPRAENLPGGEEPAAASIGSDGVFLND